MLGVAVAFTALICASCAQAETINHCRDEQGKFIKCDDLKDEDKKIPGRTLREKVAYLEDEASKDPALKLLLREHIKFLKDVSEKEPVLSDIMGVEDAWTNIIRKMRYLTGNVADTMEAHVRTLTESHERERKSQRDAYALTGALSDPSTSQDARWDAIQRFQRGQRPVSE